MIEIVVVFKMHFQMLLQNKVVENWIEVWANVVFHQFIAILFWHCIGKTEVFFFLKKKLQFFDKNISIVLLISVVLNLASVVEFTFMLWQCMVLLWCQLFLCALGFWLDMQLNRFRTIRSCSTTFCSKSLYAAFHQSTVDRTEEKCLQTTSKPLEEMLQSHQVFFILTESEIANFL